MEFEKWTTKKLGEVVNLKRGYDLPLSKREDGRFPILSSSGISDFHNKYKVKGPGVTTGRSGLLGNVYYVEDDFWPLNTSLYVEDFKENDPKFIYYLLQTMKLENYNAGSSVPTLNRNHVHLIDVDIPKKSNQVKIGQLLYNFERKIENNNCIVSSLEQLAQAMFKRWFIDFEFPNENGEHYKSSGGEMKESEFGLIPSGWELGTLENLGKIVGGGTPSKKVDEYYTNSGVSWITPKDLSNDKSIYVYKGATDITEEALRKSSANLLPENTVLFSSRAPIGYVAIAGKNVATNQGFKSIVPAQNIPTEYIFFLLKHLTPIIEANAGGSTFKEISGSGMKSIKTVLPPSTLLLKYRENVESLFEKIKLVEKETKVLIDLRDTLLPKLLSGEIEIPDENEVTEHVPIP